MKRRPILDAVEQVNDSWLNEITGQGVWGKDKLLAAVPTVSVWSQQALENLHRGSDLAARIADSLPLDALRAPPKVEIAREPELAARVSEYVSELGLARVAAEALRKARVFGGAAILVGADDGEEDLSQPLGPASSVDYLTVFEPREFQILQLQDNPLRPDYGQPLLYQFSPLLGATSVTQVLSRVHASRCVFVQGVVSSRQHLVGNNTHYGYGDSVLVRCAEHLRGYDAAWAGVAQAFTEYSQTILKTKHLREVIKADKDSKALSRWVALDKMRSVFRAILIDKDEEEFSRETVSMSGAAETLREYQARVAAAAGMPITKLFGTSSGGLGSTGQAEDTTWYDCVSAYQTDVVRPLYEDLVERALLVSESPTKGALPESWRVCFEPLYQPSDKDKAEVRNKNAQTDEIYHRLGVVSAQEIAASRWAGDGYGMDLELAGERPELEEPGEEEGEDSETQTGGAE